MIHNQGIPQTSSFGAGRTGAYGDYQAPILEEAASHEEDLDPNNRD